MFQESLCKEEHQSQVGLHFFLEVPIVSELQPGTMQTLEDDFVTPITQKSTLKRFFF